MSCPVFAHQNYLVEISAWERAELLPVETPRRFCCGKIVCLALAFAPFLRRCVAGISHIHRRGCPHFLAAAFQAKAKREVAGRPQRRRSRKAGAECREERARPRRFGGGAKRGARPRLPARAWLSFRLARCRAAKQGTQGRGATPRWSTASKRLVACRACASVRMCAHALVRTARASRALGAWRGHPKTVHAVTCRAGGFTCAPMCGGGSEKAFALWRRGDASCTSKRSCVSPRHHGCAASPRALSRAVFRESAFPNPHSTFRSCSRPSHN